MTKPLQEHKIKDPVDKNNPNYYVNNEEFKQALLEYSIACKLAKEEGKEKPQVSNYLGDCFSKIAHGLGSVYKFRNYSYIDDMISEATINCLAKIDKFDVTRGTSAFAYFTQCVYFSFLGTIKDEKRREKGKRDMFFRGEYDSFDLDSEDESFQLSYNEFIKSMGSDSTPYESEDIKKRKKFESKKTTLDDLFSEE